MSRGSRISQSHCGADKLIFLDQVLWKQGCRIMFVYAFISIHIRSAEHLSAWSKSLQESQEGAFVGDFLILIAYHAWAVTAEWSWSTWTEFRWNCPGRCAPKVYVKCTKCPWSFSPGHPDKARPPQNIYIMDIGPLAWSLALQILSFHVTLFSSIDVALNMWNSYVSCE